MSRRVRNIAAALILMGAILLWITQPVYQARRLEECMTYARRLAEEEEFFLDLLCRMEREKKWRILGENEWAGIGTGSEQTERIGWYPEEQGLYLMTRTSFPTTQGYFLSREAAGTVFPDHIRMEPLCRGREIYVYWREEGWD